MNSPPERWAHFLSRRSAWRFDKSQWVPKSMWKYNNIGENSPAKSSFAGKKCRAMDGFPLGPYSYPLMVALNTHIFPFPAPDSGFSSPFKQFLFYFIIKRVVEGFIIPQFPISRIPGQSIHGFTYQCSPSFRAQTTFSYTVPWVSRVSITRFSLSHLKWLGVPRRFNLSISSVVRLEITRYFWIRSFSSRTISSTFFGGDWAAAPVTCDLLN